MLYLDCCPEAYCVHSMRGKSTRSHKIILDKEFNYLYIGRGGLCVIAFFFRLLCLSNTSYTQETDAYTESADVADSGPSPAVPVEDEAVKPKGSRRSNRRGQQKAVLGDIEKPTSPENDTVEVSMVRVIVARHGYSFIRLL